MQCLSLTNSAVLCVDPLPSTSLPKPIPTIADAVQSIAPPQFGGGGYDFSIASGQSTTTSSTAPAHVTPENDWLQPSSSGHTHMPPSEMTGLHQQQDNWGPGVPNKQRSGDNHMTEEKAHKSEKSKNEL